MKKLLVLVSLSVLLFSSCTSVKVFDKSIPEEKTARIYTGRLGVVKEYNGISVDWKPPFISTYYQIPAGDTLLLLDVDAPVLSSNNIVYTGVVLRGEDILFKYNFQPQKTYMLFAAQKEGNNGVSVFAWNYNEKPIQMEKYFVEFVPFLNTNKGDKLILN